MLFPWRLYVNNKTHHQCHYSHKFFIQILYWDRYTNIVMINTQITYSKSWRSVQCWRPFARAWTPASSMLFLSRLYSTKHTTIPTSSLFKYCTWIDTQSIVMVNTQITYSNFWRLVQCWKLSARAWAPATPMLFPLRLCEQQNTLTYHHN